MVEKDKTTYKQCKLGEKMPQEKISTKISTLIIFIFILTVSSVGCLATGIKQKASDPNKNDVITVIHETPGQESPDESLSLEIGFEPTPIPANLTLMNTRYGFQLTYPETWEYIEIDHGHELNKGSARLVIFYRWVSAQLPAGMVGTGMPAGDRLYRDKINFLGSLIPVELLEFEGKIKMVIYNEGKPIDTGKIEIRFFLEDQDTEYSAVDLTPELIADANMILESFQLTEDIVASPNTPEEGICATERTISRQDWKLYSNEDYGFYFYYPASLEIDEEDHLVKIQNGELTMLIEYRLLEEQRKMEGFVPQGEVELTRFVNYFGEENPNPVVVERVGDQITRVSLGNLITKTTPVQFLVSIINKSGTGIDINQAEIMLEMLDYLCVTR